jgi:hypothetical protein
MGGLMRRLAVTVLLSFFCSVSWADSAVHSNFYLSPGAFAVSAGIGTQTLFDGLDAYLGFEYVFAEAEEKPLFFGASAKGIFYTFDDTYYAANWRETTFGAAALATAHLGLSMFSLPPWLDRAYCFVGMGVRYLHAFYSADYDSAYGESDYAGFGFASVGGLHYFVSDHLAVRLEGFYYGYGGLLLGILYRF